MSLITFALIIAYDPLGNKFNLYYFLRIITIRIFKGAKKYRKIKDANDNMNEINDHHDFMHRKVSKLWIRRFRLAFCCLSKDEYGDEAFSQTAELFSNLFNGTDLVPTGIRFAKKLKNSLKLFLNLDIMAGSILMRVRQKKENREYRRIQMINDLACPRYFTDLNRVFNTCPTWMTIENAQHFLRFAISSYGWPLPCAIAPCRSCYGMMRKLTCCAGLR